MYEILMWFGIIISYVVIGSVVGRITYCVTDDDVVRPDKYDDDIRFECTSGIHFFLTREEAEEYF